MTLRIDLDAVRARVAARAQARAERAAALRDRGVATLNPSTRILSGPSRVAARLLEWRPRSPKP
jgi:hypothetical protein